MTHWEIHSDDVTTSRKEFATREKASAVAELLAEDHPGAIVYVRRVEQEEAWVSEMKTRQVLCGAP